MRVLYGINSNGQGHLNRSRVVIEELKDRGIEPDVIFSGYPPPQYTRNYGKRQKLLKGVRLVYENHTVNVPKTIFNSFKTGINAFDMLHRLEPILDKANYDLIITDQEPYVPIYGARRGIPVIAVDHQHSLLHPRGYNPPGNVIDKIAAILAIRANIQYKSYAIGIDYTDTIDVRKTAFGRIMHHPLVTKPDMVKIKQQMINEGTDKLGGDRKKFVIYFNEGKFDEIVRLAIKDTGNDYLIYGRDRDFAFRNVTFKKTDRVTFVQDLIQATGIIATAGFSLSWECIQLEKPMYVIPQKNQYEQYANAARLQKLGQAMWTDGLDKNALTKFREEFIPELYQQRQAVPFVDSEVFLKRIFAIFNYLSV